MTTPFSRTSLAATAVALCLATPAFAQSGDPIKIGVIAEVQSIAGAATPGGAQIAADEINAKGGILGRKIEIVTYDNKSTRSRKRSTTTTTRTSTPSTAT